MDRIQTALCRYLQRETGIRTAAAPDRQAGVWPVLAVEVRAAGTVLLAGGRQAARSFAVTVTGARDRERTGEAAFLAALVPILLRGIPLPLTAEDTGGAPAERVLSPLDLRTEGDRLTFRLELCVPVPPRAEGTAGMPGTMERLHLRT